MIRVLKNIITKKPILIIYDVTKLCNERCPMCNIWKTKSNDMNLDQIKIIAKRLKKFGIGYVFIQGGEPTLRKDLIDIIDIFIKNKIKPTVITNGILLNRELAEQIAIRKCNLAISIDSLDEEKFKKYRGVDILSKVKENILNISNIKRKGNWAITTTISKLTTINEIKKLENFANTYGFMYAIRPYIYVNGNAGKKEDDLIYSYDDVKEIFEYMLNRARKNNYFASLIYEEHIKYMKKEVMPECDAMKYSLVMKEDGIFAPCIEFTNKQVDIDDFNKNKKKYKKILCECNNTTPCFYNDAREIGILLRKKWRIILNIPKLIKQMILYGNFF
ncbi:radical SAM protein [Vallitalea sp.]|jgi:MoaA/NifB/PqqE/SkfB family radical SAM enzyme|uniref:radical SAM protein n=1 Tax=Vallitalea sp. TaxID=1882829 RepID=UPI0025D2A1A3|nr:radical SAM protein [Vallitalea sp.]MCT4686479.1 radical SAM protein [Vallitalea sp.]